MDTMQPLSIREAAERLGLSYQRTYAIVKATEADPSRAGGLRAEWFDSQYGISPQALADFILYRAANPFLGRKRTTARRGPVRPALVAHRMAK